MPDTNKSPNYLKWIKSLYKEDLHTFSGIELEAMIRELVRGRTWDGPRRSQATLHE